MMKNLNTTQLSKLVFLLICVLFMSNLSKGQNYTNTYDGTNYSSTKPYNLNVIYFVPNDIPLDPTYKTRLSAILLWGQNFYKQNMIQNGYGPKTFGLFTEISNPNNVKIILIHGISPHTSYTYGNRTTMDSEISTYFANNPTQKTSDHSLIITAVSDGATANAPFYGTGRNCYALDYPQFDIQYLGTSSFTGWFGGMMHELGHGLNLAHTQQTSTENNNPNKGMNLMSHGNSTLGVSPTFINRAGAAILNNTQVFADTPGIRYDGHITNFTSVHTSYSNGNLTVSGSFTSNKTVKDVNIYQDPNETPGQGYNRTAWSVTPVGNTFSITMPTTELASSNGSYNLQLDLALENGENQFIYFPFNYVNGVPDIDVNYDGISTCVGGSLQFTTNIPGASYKWQYYSHSNWSWNDIPDGNVAGYATFSGTQTPTMTVSDISSEYVTNPNIVRVIITQSNGSKKYSGTQIWKAKEAITITTQPVASTTACVGSSIQLTTQASDPNATYQWQYQSSNGAWINYPEGIVSGYATFSGSQTKSMTISNISSLYINNPNQVRVFVTGSNGCTATSNTATWQAKQAVTITTQPAASTTACVGSSIQLSTQASDPNATYQWQFQGANGTWANYPEGNIPAYATFSGTQTKVMTIANISSLYINNPNQVRVFVTSSNGCTVASNTVTWQAKQAVTITTQPAASTTACVGSSIQLSTQASDPNATYQWQFQGANGTWANYPEGNIPAYATFSGTQTKVMTIANISSLYINNPNQVRVFVTGSNGCTTTSNTATWQAQNCTARSGKDTIDTIKTVTTNDQSVYPNPVKDELTVNLGTIKDDYVVEIIGSLGQVIYKTTTSDQTLKVLLSDKPSGLYIVNIKGSKTGSNKSIKVIKK